MAPAHVDFECPDCGIPLYALLAVILRDFVHAWYSKITSDETFVAEILQIIAHCTRALEQRLRKVDLESLLLDELPDLLDNHITAYRTAHNPAARPPTQVNSRDIYHALCPLVALSPVPKPEDPESAAKQQENETMYRQLLVQGVLAILLPTEDLENECLTALVGQILSELIIGNVFINKLAQPWMLWEIMIILVRVLGKREPEKTTLEEGVAEALSPDAAIIEPESSTRGWSFQGIFWGVIQWLFMAFTAVQLVVLTLASSSSLPARSTPVLDAKSSLAGSGSATKAAKANASKPVKAPIVTFKLWSCISSLIELDARTPWLSGALSMLQFGAVSANARTRPTPTTHLGGSNKLEPPSPAGSAVSSNREGGDDGEHNVAYMGTLVKSGYGQGIVFATGGNTHFGTIATSVSGTESPRSPLQLSMDDLGSQLSKVSFVIIGMISFVGWLQGKKLLEIFQISISLAVAAIPEGLPIIVTVTLALGVHRMAGHHAIVRKMPKVETLGSVNVVCTDKTGTLTMNHMTITKMWCFGSIEAFDVDSDDEATETKPDAATLRILRIGNIANNGRLARQYTENGAAARAVLSSTQGGDNPSTYTRWTGQPTDVAMLDLLDRFKEHDVRESIGTRIGEVPFSSERKWMGVTIGGQGKNDKDFSYMKGSIDRVLEACDTYLTRDGREVVLDSTRRKEALDAAEEMASRGLRVLAFASGAVRSNKNKPASNGSYFAGSDDNYKGLTFAGLVGMSDPPRPGVGKSIRRLMRGGVKVVMITGDAETTAAAIGRQLGMPVPHAVEHGSSQSAVRPVLRGDEIEAMSEEELAQAMQHTNIFARTNPDHKLKIIRAFQSRGDIVAMTGDGVNDAPALKKADIGISMGLHGTDVAKEAADMILTDDDFSTILRAIEEGKGIFNNIQNFLTFQLSTSAASLSLVFFCTLLGHPSPLNAMQILWINIIMDGPPAQSLGVEKVDKDVMNRPPRKRGDAVLTRTVLSRVMTSAAIIMTGTMLVYRHEMLSDGEVSRRDTTMTFTCFVLFDMFNALSCRSESKSILRGEIGLFSNVLFNWAVALSLVGQLLVIYFPWLQEVFQTEALGFFDLVRLVVLCSTVFWADEFRKYWKYSRRRIGGGYSQAV
ncbi:Calcium-transporting ATPase 1 like protein [Verticillium longisporum]|nr:Calcium-transporting ATPase 1 like protein [Verticillium longisporum]